ncbi:MAG: hypothetical protein ACR2QC_02375 [Gammaproteobacteria bacterium]
MRFRLLPEWCILIRRLKVPLYVKSAAIPAKAGISSRKKDRPIPAKAGISAPKGANCRRRRTNVQLPAALRRRRFLPSQEWDGGSGRIFGGESARFGICGETVYNVAKPPDSRAKLRRKHRL